MPSNEHGAVFGMQSRMYRSKIAVTFVAILAIFGTDQEQAPNAPPNVLVLFSDQHCARILGSAGFEAVRTPNLDRLADEGVRFTRCAVNHPLCTPSRASMQTGYYMELHGSIRNGAFMDPPDTTYLAEVFEAAGYVTGYAGKWHLDGARPPARPAFQRKGAFQNSYVPSGARRRGYHEWLGYQAGLDHDGPSFWDDSVDPPVLVFPKGYEWETTFHADSFLDFAARHTASGRPWMYFLSIGPPHEPNEVPIEFLRQYPRKTITMPTWITRRLTVEERLRMQSDLQFYYAQVSFIDAEIGRILDGLDALGLTKNTLVVYLSDHGDTLGSHWGEIWPDFRSSPLLNRDKRVPFANSIRVPLIFRWPGRIPPGLSVDALISMVDVPRTILSLGNLPIPTRMQGQDMRAWCLGEIGPARDAIYLSLSDSRDASWTGLWTGDYIYSESLAFPVLYDLGKDPYETTNVLSRPQYADVRAMLRARLTELEAAAYVAGNGSGVARESGSGSQCLVATATYGTPVASELDVLRELRDRHLLTTHLGTAFVDTYYRVSPGISNRVAVSPLFRSALRYALKPVIVAAWRMTPTAHDTSRAGPS